MNKIKQILHSAGSLFSRPFRKAEGPAEAVSEEKFISHYFQTARSRRALAVVVLAAVLLVSWLIYRSVHVYRDYTIVSSTERNDSSATSYLVMDGQLLKYSPDGVSCISMSNEVKWSTTFSIQAPLIDICGGTAAVAEQKGNQIYVFGEDGLMGQFKTDFPILKLRVASQGVVAVALEDGEVTWIKLFDSEGNELVSDRSSITESGYPVALDISDNGQRLAVSYLCAAEGSVYTRVVFYGFDSVGQGKANNEIGSAEYTDAIVPEIYFTSGDTAVAVKDRGFSVFRGKQEPSERAAVEFEQEILSVFHDDTYIGFIFANDSAEENKEKYRMEIYNLNGKRVGRRNFDFEYKEIKMMDGKILMNNEKNCVIYTKGGKTLFETAYEKPISYFASIPGFRRYLVITPDSIDKIRMR